MCLCPTLPLPLKHEREKCHLSGYKVNDILSLQIWVGSAKGLKLMWDKTRMEKRYNRKPLSVFKFWSHFFLVLPYFIPKISTFEILPWLPSNSSPHSVQSKREYKTSHSTLFYLKIKQNIAALLLCGSLHGTFVKATSSLTVLDMNAS